MLWDIIRLDLLFCVLNGQRTLDIHILFAHILHTNVCEWVCWPLVLSLFRLLLCWTIFAILTCIGNRRETLSMVHARAYTVKLLLEQKYRKQFRKIRDKKAHTHTVRWLLFALFSLCVRLISLLWFLFENVNRVFFSSLLCVHPIRYLILYILMLWFP